MKKGYLVLGMAMAMMTAGAAFAATEKTAAPIATKTAITTKAPVKAEKPVAKKSLKRVTKHQKHETAKKAVK